MNYQSQPTRIAAALFVGFVALLGPAAHADRYPGFEPEQGQGASSTLSRIEVLNDLQAYRASGLAAAEWASAEQGRNNADLLQRAQMRYAQLTQQTLHANAPLTRSEVLADLQIYQESGLAAAERFGEDRGHETQAHRAARERYAALRQGARYASLVELFGQRTGEPQQVNGG